MRKDSSALEFPFAERRSVTTDIDRTVTPERKLMTAVSEKLTRSSTGLMTTPPPIPLIAPPIEAKRLTRKAGNICEYCTKVLLKK